MRAVVRRASADRRRYRRRRSPSALGALVALLLWVFHASALDAQTARVSGRVVSSSGTPLPGAIVAVVGSLWEARTDRNGRYEVRVTTGESTLRARLLGFQSHDVSVVVTARGRDSVDIVLSSAPNTLRGVVVTGAADDASSDLITRSMVQRLPALGEADILRVLPLMPGVSQPNDLIGRTHFAGGASDESGLRLDGHPLQSPYHLDGIFGAFNVASLEAATVRIHHLPASIEGHASGVIDLESRRGGDKAFAQVAASVLSASATAGVPHLIQGIDAMISGRVTYLDRVLSAYTKRTGATNDDLLVPSFSDLLLRLGSGEPSEVRVEFLAYGTWDRLPPSLSTSEQPPGWGEQLIGVRALRQFRAWSFQARLSSDRATTSFTGSSTSADDPQPSSFIDIDQRAMNAAMEVERRAQRWRLSAGSTFRVRRHELAWSGARAVGYFRAALPTPLRVSQSQTLGGAFVEGDVLLSDGWSGTIGTHVTVGRDGVLGAPRLLVAGRLATPLRLELSYDRRHQFEAIAGEPREGSIGQPLFLLDAPIQVDAIASTLAWRPVLAHVGVRGLRATVSAKRYRQRARGGSLVAGNGVLDASADTLGTIRSRNGHALGASVDGELSVRDGMVLQANYTVQRSWVAGAGSHVPADWDIPHQGSLFGSVRLGRHWEATAAVQLHSGSVTTPPSARLFVPQLDGGYQARFIAGAQNSARLPMYQRADVGLRRVWRGWSADWTLSAQVLNVLAHDNILEYGTLAYVCNGDERCLRRSGAVRRSGLPIMPSLGIEARW